MKGFYWFLSIIFILLCRLFLIGVLNHDISIKKAKKSLIPEISGQITASIINGNILIFCDNL